MPLLMILYSRNRQRRYVRAKDDPKKATSIRAVILASFIGTSIEWYDFFLYGTAAALVFNRLFFPTLDSLAGTMASFATYAVGFFARPLGGIVFGHYGDKLGRKAMLVTTLLMMGLSTFLAGAVLLGLGLFIRLHILETPLFAQAQAERATSSRPLLDWCGTTPGTCCWRWAPALPRTPVSTSSRSSFTCMPARRAGSRET